MEKYGYIYKTINLRNNKIYIGKRVGEYTPEYYGSGLIINRAIRKNGKDNFKLELLVYAKDKDKLNELEKSYIAEYRRIFGNYKVYNIANGGDGGDTISNNPRLEEIKEKCRLQFTPDHPIFSEESTIKRVNTRKNSGNPWISEETKLKIGEANKGMVFTKETRTKLRAKRAGKTPMLGKKHSLETRKQMSISRSGEGNAMFGRHLSEESRAKISLSLKRRK